MAKITYEDKETLNENSGIADKNKGRAQDWNEIKSVINETILTLLGLDVDTYSTSKSYKIGDLVIYDNKIQECIGSTSGTWDSTKWSMVPIIEKVEE